MKVHSPVPPCRLGDKVKEMRRWIYTENLQGSTPSSNIQGTGLLRQKCSIHTSQIKKGKENRKNIKITLKITLLHHRNLYKRSVRNVLDEKVNLFFPISFTGLVPHLLESLMDRRYRGCYHCDY